MSMPEAAVPLRGQLPALVVATAGGIGLLRPASGTWATLATGLLCLLIIPLFHGYVLTLVLLGLTVVATVLGILCAPAAIRHWRRLDPSQVVIDEVAGTLIGLACVPPAILSAQPVLAVGVIMGLFRVFDIVKPYPVSALETLPGSYGIMTDDLAAGLCAGLLAATVLA